MAYFRRTGSQIALFVLALIGIAISIYLTSVHYENVPLICSTSGFVNCDVVIRSRFGYVPGTTIPITIPGLLWNLVIAGLAVAGWRMPDLRILRLAELVWSALGMLTVFYLVYVEIVILHTICAWCTVLHVIILAMLLISIVQLQGEEIDEEEVEMEDEKPAVRATRDS